VYLIVGCPLWRNKVHKVHILLTSLKLARLSSSVMLHAFRSFMKPGVSFILNGIISYCAPNFKFLRSWSISPNGTCSWTDNGRPCDLDLWLLLYNVKSTLPAALQVCHMFTAFGVYCGIRFRNYYTILVLAFYSLMTLTFDLFTSNQLHELHVTRENFFQLEAFNAFHFI